MAFAATAATIVSGAVAERMNFGAFCILSGYMTGWVYPVVAHWVWSPNGWLYKDEFIDFAGTGVVHLVGGVAGLVSCLFLGKRLDRFNKQGYFDQIVPSNNTNVVLGTFILWFGWYAFNCGSTASAVGENVINIGRVGVNTTISAVFGALTSFLLHFLLERKT